MLTKPSAGHYIFNAIHKSITSLWKKHAGIKIKIKWVPGHKGVEGNEKADEEVKKAITDSSSPADKLPNLLRKKLLYSKAAMVQAYGKKLKGRAQKAWVMLQRYNKMKKTDPTTPSNKYLKLITPLLRKLTSILSQLKTGHVPLAKHLHHIGKADSPTCPACHQAEETTQHFLLHCPAHNAARQSLHNNTGGRSINITKLLTTPKTLCALFLYITQTGRWQNSFGETTNIRGGIEEKSEKSIDKQWTTHLYYTWPQHHLVECKTAPRPHQWTTYDDEEFEGYDYYQTTAQHIFSLLHMVCHNRE